MWNPFRRRDVSADAEERAVTSVPWVQGGDPFSGPVTAERALSLAPVYGAVRIIAQDVSTLPLKAYRRTSDFERSPMSTLPMLFRTMVDDGSLVPWLFRCVTSLALRGNAYGLVVSRDGFQFPANIVWLNPGEVVWREKVGDYPARWLWRGREVPSEDMVHIPWFVLPGQKEGLSPIGAFASLLGVGIKAQDYGEGWFDNGGVPPGTFKNSEKTVTQADSDEIRGRLVAAIRTRKPLVYGRDWQYDPIQVSPAEAQFVETMKLNANQVAAIYGVRPERIGGEAGSSLTYSTVSQNQLEHNTSTLRYWLELLEGAFFALLPERQFVKFNADAVVRNDLKTRWEVHRIRREIGAASIDEIRALEDEQPLPDGQGQDYTPLKSSGQQQDTEPEGGGTVTELDRKRVPR